MGSTETHSTKQTLLLVGAGPIGLTAASAAASDGVARVIGVIDLDEQARQNAGEILACTTYPSLADLEGECPDVALVEFISSTAAAAPTVMSLVANGCWRRHRRDRSESRFRDAPARHDGCHCRTRRAHRHCGPAAGHTDKTRSTGRQDGLRLAGRRVPRTGRSGDDWDTSASRKARILSPKSLAGTNASRPPPSNLCSTPMAMSSASIRCSPSMRKDRRGSCLTSRCRGVPPIPAIGSPQVVNSTSMSRCTGAIRAMRERQPWWCGESARSHNVPLASTDRPTDLVADY